MGFDPQKRLAKSHKTGDVEDRIWCELVKLHTVNIKKPTKELVGRKRESTEKKGKEHHPVATLGLGDPLGAGEDDGVIVGDETIRLGLIQLLLRESRGYQARRGICRLPLGHLVLRRQMLHTHLRFALGGLCRRTTGHKDWNNGGGGGDKELVNSTNPHSPLIYLLGEGTRAKMWCKERKRQPTNGRGKYKITALPTKWFTLNQSDVYRNLATDVMKKLQDQR
jgi:hypothetical protein